MVACVYILYLLSALAAGMIGGKNGSKKFFFRSLFTIFAAGTLLCTLALIFPETTMKYLWLPNPGVRYVFGNNVPELYFGTTVFISFEAFLAVTLLLDVAALSGFLLLWNCRKMLKNWYSAIGGALAVLAVTTLTLPMWYTSGMWYILAQKQISDPVTVYILMPVMLNVIAGIMAAALILWTTLNLIRERSSWKTLLKDCAVFAGCAAIVMLINCLCGYFFHLSARQTAEKHGIEPIFHARNFPPDESWKLMAAHPLYSPPYSGRYEWFNAPDNGDAVPDEEKVYTIANFEHPDIVRYRQIMEETVSSCLAATSAGEEINCMPQLRSVTRHYNDLAALYQHTGKPDKVIEVLQKYPELDRRLPEKTSFVITSLVISGCRSIWLTGVIRHAPDAAKYAPVYRKFLHAAMNWEPYTPDEGGVYLAPFDKYFSAPFLAGFKVFHYPPIWYAAEYKGVNIAADRIPRLRELEKQFSFTPDDLNDRYTIADKNKRHFSPYNTLLRQRAVISGARTALALKCFRAEHGRYPEKLADLIPEYLPQIYPSPDGKPLDYQSDGRNFTLKITGVTEFIIATSDHNLSTSPTKEQ